MRSMVQIHKEASQCACTQHRALQEDLPLHLSGTHPLLHLQSGLLVFCPNQVLPDISNAVSSHDGDMWVAEEHLKNAFLCKAHLQQRCPFAMRHQRPSKVHWQNLSQQPHQFCELIVLEDCHNVTWGSMHVQRADYTCSNRSKSSLTMTVPSSSCKQSPSAIC